MQYVIQPGWGGALRTFGRECGQGGAQVCGPAPGSCSGQWPPGGRLHCTGVLPWPASTTGTAPGPISHWVTGLQSYNMNFGVHGLDTCCSSISDFSRC